MFAPYMHIYNLREIFFKIINKLWYDFPVTETSHPPLFHIQNKLDMRILLKTKQQIGSAIKLLTSIETCQLIRLNI